MTITLADLTSDEAVEAAAKAVMSSPVPSIESFPPPWFGEPKAWTYGGKEYLIFEDAKLAQQMDVLRAALRAAAEIAAARDTIAKMEKQP